MDFDPNFCWFFGNELFFDMSMSPMTLNDIYKLCDKVHLIELIFMSDWHKFLIFEVLTGADKVVLWL